MLFCRHKGGDRGSRRRRPARRLVGGTTWNFSQRLPWWFEATLTTRLWWFKRVCGSIFGFLMGRCAVLGRRSIWAVLRLVAAWQFGTGVLWASVACFVNCTLIRQHPCPRVACYCAFAAGGGGGRWRAAQRDFGNSFSRVEAGARTGYLGSTLVLLGRARTLRGPDTRFGIFCACSLVSRVRICGDHSVRVHCC